MATDAGTVFIIVLLGVTDLVKLRLEVKRKCEICGGMLILYTTHIESCVSETKANSIDHY